MGPRRESELGEMRGGGRTATRDAAGRVSDGQVFAGRVLGGEWFGMDGWLDKSWDQGAGWCWGKKHVGAQLLA